MGLRLLSHVVFDPNYFPLYIKLIFIFVIFAFNGLMLFNLSFKTRNKFLLLGGGMIVGPLIFLLILAIFSYIFKGSIVIAALFFIYTIICLFLYKFNKASFLSLIKFKKTINTSLIIVITNLYLLFILINSGNAFIGGDSETYWGIATSFARGNYPTVLPWQPNFLTVYHQGIFMVEGAIHSLASINISIVHTFFSAYIVSAVFLFVTGLAREKTRSIICIIPAVFGLILFGGPLIYLPKLDSHILSWVRLFDPTVQNLSGDFNIFSQFADFKRSLGAGANNFDSLIYLNFHAFGIATYFLFLLLIWKNWGKEKFYNNLILLTLLILTLSIDESLFLVELPIFLIFYFSSFKNLKLIFFLRNSMLLCLFTLILFFLIQNPVRDSFFTGGNKEARFKLLSTKDLIFTDRIGFMHGMIIDPKNLPTFWYIPDLRFSIALAIILSLLRKSKMATILAISSLFSLTLSLLIVNTYWPANGLRFTNMSYELLMYAMGFLFIDYFIYKRGLFSLLILIFLFFIMLPQFTLANIHFFKDAFTHKLENLTRGAKIQDKALDWISDNIPYDKKFLFIDGYGQDQNFSQMTLTAIQYYGIFSPTVTGKIKLLNLDFAGEWYDSQVFLSPRSLRDLNIDNIFIKNSQYGYLSTARQKQLQDSQFFKVVYTNEEGKLYKVEPIFKEQKNDEMTLADLADSIPDGKVVYLDKFKYREIRKGLLISLSDRTKLIGPRYDRGYDQPMYIESFLPMVPDDRPKVKQLKELIEVDFVLIDQNRNPESILNGQFGKVAEIRDVSLYKKYK